MLGFWLLTTTKVAVSLSGNGVVDINGVTLHPCSRVSTVLVCYLPLKPTHSPTLSGMETKHYQWAVTVLFGW